MPTTQTTPVPSASRLARWLEGYRILASGQSLDAEEAHHAWVLQEATPRTLHVSDVAAVLEAFTELTEAVAAVDMLADDSALFERAERALVAAQQLIGADTTEPAVPEATEHETPWVPITELMTGDHVFVRTLDSSRHLGQSYTGVVEELHAIGGAGPHGLSLRCYTDVPAVELHTDDLACIIRLGVTTSHPVAECQQCADNLQAAKANAVATGSVGCTYGGEVAGIEHVAVWDRSMLYGPNGYIG